MENSEIETFLVVRTSNAKRKEVRFVLFIFLFKETKKQKENGTKEKYEIVFLFF